MTHTESWSLGVARAPEFAALACPRRYCADSRFHPQHIASVGILTTLVSAHNDAREGRPSSHGPDYMAIHQLVSMQVPTYFVAPEFLKAAMASTIPSNFRWTALKWPLDAMLFILPRGGVKVADGSELAYVAFGRHDAGAVKAVSPNLPGVLYGETLVAVAAGTDRGLCSSASMSITDSQSVVETVAEGLNRDLTDTSAVPVVPENIYTLVREIALKLVLAVSARPNFIERGAMTRPASKKHGRERSELWSPNIIGASYRTKVEDSAHLNSGSGSPKRLHWVRGHYRQQPYGPRETPRYETIWIEPFMAGSVPLPPVAD